MAHNLFIYIIESYKASNSELNLYDPVYIKLELNNKRNHIMVIYSYCIYNTMAPNDLFVNLDMYPCP